VGEGPSRPPPKTAGQLADPGRDVEHVGEDYTPQRYPHSLNEKLPCWASMVIEL
jgi:hypothetical protein